MEKPNFPLAVVMQRRRAQSPWADIVWEPHGVVPGYGGDERKLLVQHDATAQWLHPGFKLELHRDEIEGYYENVVTADPRVFVLWRMEGDDALPVEVTVSLTGYQVNAIFRTFTFTGKPSSTMPYFGSYCSEAATCP